MISNQYWAGLFDGEGYVGLGHNKAKASTFILHVRVVNCNEYPLTLLVEQFGGSVYNTESGQRKHRLYCWTAYGNNAATFLSAINTYSIIKKNQIDLALRFLQESYKGVGRGGMPLEAAQRRTWYFEEFKRLKRSSFERIED